MIVELLVVFGLSSHWKASDCKGAFCRTCGTHRFIMRVDLPLCCSVWKVARVVAKLEAFAQRLQRAVVRLRVAEWVSC